MFLSFAMTILNKRVFYGLGCAVLIAAGISALLPADPAVNGLSHKDVVQIRDIVRGEIWRSPQRGCHSPGLAIRLARFGVRFVTGLRRRTSGQDLAGEPLMKSGESSTLPENTWLITTTEGDVFIVEKREGYWRINGRG